MRHMVVGGIWVAHLIRWIDGFCHHIPMPLSTTMFDCVWTCTDAPTSTSGQAARQYVNEYTEYKVYGYTECKDVNIQLPRCVANGIINGCTGCMRGM